MSAFNTIQGNSIWSDLGFSDAESEELDLRSELLRQVQLIMSESGLNQNELASILGVDQPKISKLKNGKLSEFSSERLMLFLNKLGYCIQIRVVPLGSKSKSNRKQIDKRQKVSHLGQNSFLGL